MTSEYMLTCIFMAALINISLRYAPFLAPGSFLRKGFIQFLGRYLPGVIMSILVIFCIKDTFGHQDKMLMTLVSGTFVALIHIWKRNVLLSIGGGTALYMFLISNI